MLLAQIHVEALGGTGVDHSGFYDCCLLVCDIK
jgi:hypothetical protein